MIMINKDYIYSQLRGLLKNPARGAFSRTQPEGSSQEASQQKHVVKIICYNIKYLTLKKVYAIQP